VFCAFNCVCNTDIKHDCEGQRRCLHSKHNIMTSGTNSRGHQCVIPTPERLFKCRLSPADERTANVRKIHLWHSQPSPPVQHQFQNIHFTCKQQSGGLQSNRPFHTGFQFTASTAQYTVPREMGRKTYRHFTVSSIFLQTLQSNYRNNIKQECELYRAIPNSNER
jgi:hypothetical protein